MSHGKVSVKEKTQWYNIGDFSAMWVCMGRRIIGMWLTAAAVLCGLQAAHLQAGEPLRVVSSIAPVNLLVQGLAGPEVSAQSLLNAKADPHEFALRVSERSLLSEADLVIWIGPNLERFLVKALPDTRAQLELSQLPGLTWPQEQPRVDLHLWLNPANAKLMASAIAERLCALLPASAPAIQQRLSLLHARIDSVSAQIKTRLAPVQAVPFGVAHDGYGHWVSYFGLNQVAALSVLPEQSLGAKHLSAVQQKLQGARCVISDFSEGNQQKLQALLSLPIQVADPLAQARPYADYGEFLLALADVFSACLSPAG
ncbi:MAG TPA: zinc ABC transporter substrate-binding protein [Cellvibrionaceae bacterium]|nr:zinc ABC transporter substrate-binding protein [Cellvibrionaceae bacterium]HMW72308.1 zinc ABC transporter substrate-binding protein [Cellvibrionaceae bacterium]HNG61269.1 zinc ABC transporter substrate-binding protein [Cellvibrionaceae bacterium]